MPNSATETTSSWKRQTALLVILCCATGLYSLWRGTDANWDLRNYHLYSAYAFLNGRIGFDIAPGQLQSYFNPLSNLPIYALVRLLNDHPRAVAFLMGAPAGIYAFALSGISLLMARWAFGPGLMAPLAAIVATLAGMTGAAVMPGIGMSANDVAIATFVMLALWAVLRAAEIGPQAFPRIWPMTATAGLLAGAALGLKLTNIIYVAPLGLTILAFLGLRHAIIAATGMVVGFIVCWAPQAMLLWREFGNPVFPLYNDIFASPDYRRAGIADLRFLPRSTLQAVFYPFYWLRENAEMVTELRMRDSRVAIGYLAALVLIVDLLRHGLHQAWKNERPTLILLCFSVMTYVIWVRLFGIYRYLLVLESLSVVLAMLALARLLASRKVLAFGSFAGLMLLASLTTQRPDWGHVAYGARVVSFDPVPDVPAGSMLIMIGDEPMSYVIPFLPADIRALGHANNLMRLTDDHGLARRGREALAGHTGPIRLLAQPSLTPDAIEASLAPLGLRLGACSLLRSNIEPGGHRLCELSRTGG
ncbi:hypothetical protein [Roseococcus sp.]|uniref:hypothetical protein n=1 Tax=Roseococcus sp. TaxID=2109646 RepID=UPI003BACCF22